MLSLKSTHKPIREYYKTLDDVGATGAVHEGAVAPAFAALLRSVGSQVGWTLVEQHSVRRQKSTIRLDGALLDSYTLMRGAWEAKDSHDDLALEVQRKFAAGYPHDNIMFQAPQRVILWQDGRQVLDADISKPEALVDALNTFFNYTPPQYEAWDQAVAEFRQRVPELAQGVLNLIEQERQANRNPRFIAAFSQFHALVRDAINPNISVQAVEEMLIQHLLTERIFRKVFNNPDFVNRNVIAREIETVIQALTSRSFNRNDFLKNLDRFYGAIEQTAATIDDFSHKQDFLNTVYENFFQGFSVRVADTHGIVYTPQPIVDFMVRSVEAILKREFNTSLGNNGVHVLDPFVGTGNFLLRVMREIPRSRLASKYANELHCNEVMLLPYYIASMNIEHLYYELTGNYQPFEGICLVDTFELAEVGAGQQLGLFVPENTERVKKQQQQDIFVIIGNPPYNAWQVNENDNNKNRKYDVLDQRVAQTYVKDSNATNNSALSDPYVKAFRWASDRITRNGDEGIVAFVSNNSFIDALAFDGMRKHLFEEYDRIYVLDLKGNVRKDSMRDGIPIGEQHTVFGLAAMVGISVTFLIKGKHFTDKKIYYSTVDFRTKRVEKFALVDQAQQLFNLQWQEVTPDRRQTWLTEGLDNDFDQLLPIGTKEAKSGQQSNSIFIAYSRGLETTRDNWVYNFGIDQLARNMDTFIQTYNSEVHRWQTRTDRHAVLDNFVNNDDTKIKWSSSLKSKLQQHHLVTFNQNNIRQALYRPFTKQWVYFDNDLNHRTGQWSRFLPNPEAKNHIIWLKVGSEIPMFVLMVDCIPDLLPQGGSQCFPFYVYDDDGTNRRENISDWALAEFQARVQPSPLAPLRGSLWDSGEGDVGHAQSQNLTPSPQSLTPITKWDIFHYIYAMLHAPDYRERYAANLRRELPRIPIVAADDFWRFVHAGRRLAEIHVNYEQQAEYPLTWRENPDAPLNWRVEKMRLNADKTSLRYNDFLSLDGIPTAAYDYKLGNRSALEWLIDQYRVSVDQRSGISNDPNRADDPEYIVRLIGKIITVSLETVQIVANLPKLGDEVAR